MDRGPWLTSPMALFMVWSILTFIVRSWAKLRTKNWAWDDWVITAALLIALGHVIITFYALQHGYGRPLSDLSQSAISLVDKCLFSADLLYIMVLGLSKVSVALFIAHLSYSPRSSPPYLLATVAGVWALISAMIMGLHGSESWTAAAEAKSMHLRWFGIEISGLVIEFALWLLSIHLVWNLQMRLQKRIFILGAFGFRLLMIPIVTYRLIYLSPEHNTNPTYTTIVPNIITEALMQFAIISASVTSLKPFLQSLHPARMVSSAAESSGLVSADRTGSRGDLYYRLDPLKPVAKPLDHRSRTHRVSILGGQRDLEFGSDEDLHRRL